MGKCRLDHVYSGQGLVESTLKPTINVCHCIGAMNVAVRCYTGLIMRHRTALANGEHDCQCGKVGLLSRYVSRHTRRTFL